MLVPFVASVSGQLRLIRCYFLKILLHRLLFLLVPLLYVGFRFARLLDIFASKFLGQREGLGGTGVDGQVILANQFAWLSDAVIKKFVKSVMIEDGIRVDVHHNVLRIVLAQSH